MLPKHGKIECRACFNGSNESVIQINPNWRMVNDPGAFGGDKEPKYLVLGFSKGANQVKAYKTGEFESTAFAGMRGRLTDALRVVGVLNSTEEVDGKIENKNSDIAFGSLIRCSVTRLDKSASKKQGVDVYACTGPLITKSFKEIPEVLSNCSQRYLTDLPKSIKAVFFLGNTEDYVKSCQGVIENLFKNDFKKLNPMACYADGRLWIHLAHPSGSNGHFTSWLYDKTGPGAKRIQAIMAMRQI